MGLLSFLTGRKPEPQPVKKEKADWRGHFSIKFTGDAVQEFRDGLNFVKDRRGFRSQAEAALFLVRSFKAHEEKRLKEQGVPTLPKREKASEKIGNYASALPPVPKVSLAGRAEIQDRIDLCRAVLRNNADMPAGLRKSWEYALDANERVAVLLESGLPLESRRTAGVLVDHRHYYRPGPGRAKLKDRADFVLMDVHSFVAAVGAA